MKKTKWLFGCLWMCAAGGLIGQEEPKAATSPAAPAPVETPDQATLEQRFSETLQKATFSGRWCLIEEGKMGQAKEETYTIQGVKKLGKDVWLIHARIQYGQRDVSVPIPVHVNWAGDTAVISVTDFGIPGGGTYTARVLIYGDTYAGTWSGGKHGGLLNGVIRREQQE